MKDRLTIARRSWNMSRIKGKDTRPERLVRSLLHRMGFRFRLHAKRLPGKPDIVLPSYRTVVFVHGCFWHRHRGCKNCTTPTNNRAFWVKKLNGNAARDRKHAKLLAGMGWRAIVVWECEVERDLGRLRGRLLRCLRGSNEKPGSNFRTSGFDFDAQVRNSVERGAVNGARES